MKTHHSTSLGKLPSYTPINNKFPFKAVQLDLARQKESLVFIEEFIAFIAQSGYNTLFLYLEWRLRTKSFSGLSGDESYSISDMQRIIDYAARHHIEVVPGLAVLGHCEVFLNVPGNEQYSELNKTVNGRFSDHEITDLCPTHPGIRTILGDYLADVAAVFPSRYIHLGGDECWHINSCPRCRTQGADFTTESKIYADHMIFCSDLVSQQLQKSPMMWDDMWEYYPDQLPRMPKELIMVNWQYQKDVTFNQGHFLNLDFGHRLQEYDRLGLSYVMAPADFYSTSNSRTFYDYCKSGEHCLGGLLTCWTKQRLFMYRTYIRIAYSGALWSQKKGDLFKEVAQQLFGIDDPPFIDAVRFSAEAHNIREYDADENTLLCFDYFGLNYGAQAGRELTRNVFERYLPEVKSELGKNVLADLILMYDFQDVAFRAHRYIRSLCDRHNPDKDQEREIAEDLEDLCGRYSKAWEVWRPGITPDRATPYYREALVRFKRLCADIPKATLLSLHCALPDGYSSCRATLTIHDQTGANHCVSETVKPQKYSQAQFFRRVFLLDGGITPVSLRIDTTGFGGLGVCYIELSTSSGHYIPHQVISVTGTVETPEYLLEKDCKWAFVGSRNTKQTYQNRSESEEASSLAVSLIKVSDEYSI